MLEKLDKQFEWEAKRRQRSRDVSAAGLLARRYHDVYVARGAAGFFLWRDEADSWRRANGNLPMLTGSLALLLWSLGLIFQSEGLEIDTLRRRHPMWEWLFSHPAPPSAIFLAEMLAPIAANPALQWSPLFPAVLFGMVYGVGYGALAALLIGTPIVIAAACLGKALEIGIMLRFAPRARGAMIGLMSWAGFSSLMLILMTSSLSDGARDAFVRLLAPLQILRLPLLGLLLGQSGGDYSFPRAVLATWTGAALVVALSVAFSL